VAISINWLTKVIFIPKNYLTPVGTDLFELDVNQFRLDLKDIEDGGEGMYFEDTHRHSTESVLAGVTYARQFEVINGYTVEFEDDGTPNGHYQVRLYGANHNISDVKVKNSVSIIVQNSAGLQTVSTGGGGPTATQIAAAVWSHPDGAALTTKMSLVEKILRNKTITDPVNGDFVLYDNDGTTELFRVPLWEDAGASQQYRGQGAERRERLA